MIKKIQWFSLCLCLSWAFAFNGIGKEVKNDYDVLQVKKLKGDTKWFPMFEQNSEFHEKHIKSFLNDLIDLASKGNMANFSKKFPDNMQLKHMDGKRTFIFDSYHALRALLNVSGKKLKPSPAWEFFDLKDAKDKDLTKLLANKNLAERDGIALNGYMSLYGKDHRISTPGITFDFFLHSGKLNFKGGRIFNAAKKGGVDSHVIANKAWKEHKKKLEESKPVS